MTMIKVLSTRQFSDDLLDKLRHGGQVFTFDRGDVPWGSGLYF